jgi:hypothetical protein
MVFACINRGKASAYLPGIFIGLTGQLVAKELLNYIIKS